MGLMRQCRSCLAPLERSVVDLGMQPLSNAFLSESDLAAPETFYPLHVFVCTVCWLMQIEAVAPREAIFNEEYAYFSSFSTSWLEHAQQYAERMIAERSLDRTSLVVELASNDGYLLQWFVA